MKKLSTLFLALSLVLPLVTSGFAGVTVVQPTQQAVKRVTITGYGHGKSMDLARADAEEDAGRKLSLARAKKYTIKEVKYYGGKNSAPHSCYIVYNAEI
jgi:hypothetical protein